MKLSLFLIGFLLTINCFSQKWGTEEYIEKYNYQEVIGHIKNDKKECKPDKYAMYPNGKKGIYQLIREKVKIPKKAIRKKISGKVIVKYVVGTNGNVQNIEVIQSVDKLLDKAAVKVIKSMERWIPGKKDGENLKVEYRQPFVFNL